MKYYAFPKAQHLYLKSEIDDLFLSGAKSQGVYPLRAVFRIVDADRGPKVKVLISVSKRLFKHAVDRNRVKRQIREIYRYRRTKLETIVPEGKCMHIAWIWIGHKHVDTDFLATRFDSLIDSVQQRLLPPTPIQTSTLSNPHE